jgi:hypothetical protein
MPTTNNNVRVAVVHAGSVPFDSAACVEAPTSAVVPKAKA